MISEHMTISCGWIRHAVERITGPGVFLTRKQCSRNGLQDPGYSGTGFPG